MGRDWHPEVKKVIIPSPGLIKNIPKYALAELDPPDVSAFEAACLEFGENSMQALIHNSGGQFKVATAYGQALDSGQDLHVVFEFIGPPDFQSIPWELLKDPDPEAKDHPALKYRFRRGGSTSTNLGPNNPRAEKLKVLWVVARPILPLGMLDTIPQNSLLDPVQATIGNSAEITLINPGDPSFSGSGT